MPQVNYLKYLCAKNNISLLRLSRETGISIRALRIYKNGQNQRGIPWPRSIALGEYFAVSPLSLFGFNNSIEISDQEYNQLFPPKIPPKLENPLINLFLTQRRSLKDTHAFLKRNDNKTP